MKKIALFLLIVVLSTAIFIGYCGYEVERYSKERTFNKVGMVLGTSKYNINGKLNRFYKYRIEAAAEAFYSGKIEYVIVSGDNAQAEYNEPLSMKESLMEKGVPEETIYMDHAGFSTLDSVVRAKEVFHLNSYTVISQEFHNKRAIYIGRNNNIDIIGYNAENIQRAKIKRREHLARVKAFLDIKILKTKPKFLGEKVYIGEKEEK